VHVKLAVVDVGSNTIRLLVARPARAGLVRVRTEKARVGLGEDVELLGRISDAKLSLAAGAVRRLSRIAREQGAKDVAVLVTSPGRQAANSGELVRALERAAGAPVRVLSAEEEGRLAYAGALGAVPAGLHGLVAVCDLGGASTEVAVGRAGREPSWLRSVDLGAVRLTARCALGEFAGRKTVAAARREVESAFSGFAPPLPATALAVGGTARALDRLVGPCLGAEELDAAAGILSTRTHAWLRRRYQISTRRAHVLLGGTLILAEVQRRLVVPLEVVEAGVREGALLEELEQAAA
jgi:exopolyphosphatase/guanosine-5'-triphosphate,3'-diphosphate pyrophosphatase